MDFAFFAVNFGYSKRDYEELTLRDKVFIIKAWENKMVVDSSSLYKTFITAIGNAFRKKNGRLLKLFTPKPKKADKEKIKENLKLVKELEITEGMDWIKQIYSDTFRKM